MPETRKREIVKLPPKISRLWYVDVSEIVTDGDAGKLVFALGNHRDFPSDRYLLLIVVMLPDIVVGSVTLASP